MTSTSQKPAPALDSLSVDPLAETLHQLKLTGTLYCRSELSAPWGIEFPVLPGCMMFHIVTQGHYWLEIEGSEPQLLQQGSLALIPHGNGHIACSASNVKTQPLFDIPVETVSQRYEIMRHGGGGDTTHLTCGVVRFDQVAGKRLLAQLPNVLRIDSWSKDEEDWLKSTLRFIAKEAKALQPGSEAVITRLADILIIQAIRSWIDTAAEAKQGWLAALRDKQVGQALALIHKAPEKDWSIESLAKHIGMSRSAFSARFTQLLGEPVIQYLTQWRMQLARTRLIETSEPIAVIANHCGYQSEAAFSRAYKKIFGSAPGGLRKKMKA